MRFTNPLDYLPAPREYFNAEVGDYVDPDEVFVPSCDACSALRVDTVVPGYRANTFAPGHLRANPFVQTGTYADLPEIQATIDDALTRFGIRPRLGSYARKVPVKFTTGGSSRAGYCGYNRRTGETRILLNRTAWSVFSPQERMNTVLHEAAHAIEYILHGQSDHGPRWKSIAGQLGCSSDRCLTPEASHAMRAAVAKRRGLPPPAAPTGATRDMFKVGDLVSFPARGGQTVTGIIKKKAPVRAQVSVQNATYRVTYHYLTRLSGVAPTSFVPSPVTPTPAPFVPRSVTHRPPQYLHMLRMSPGGTARSTARFYTYDAAREALSDFVTNTENSSGLRVIEASILVEESNAPVRVVKTFRRKT